MAEVSKGFINSQISGLLSEINDAEAKKQISDFFLEDLAIYLEDVIRLKSDILKQEAYSLELEKNLDRLNTQILLKGFCLEELLSDKKITQKIKDSFRQLVGSLAYESLIVKRAFEKPRGYPGDYKMLEIIYDNKPISENFGIYFDNYFLKNPYAVAVKIRKDRLKELLQDFINKSKLNRIDILNIACGSCREIRELIPNVKTKSSLVFNCIDWDEEALKFSQDIISRITLKNVEFNFIKEDVLNMVKSKVKPLGKQNLIYSIGLIDYLPDRVLKSLIFSLYQLLQKDGRLILTHKNKEKTFPPIPPDWFCNWKFVSRNREEVAKLIYNCNISSFLLSIESDDFGYIHYFTITKR